MCAIFSAYSAESEQQLIYVSWKKEKFLSANYVHCPKFLFCISILMFVRDAVLDSTALVKF